MENKKESKKTIIILSSVIVLLSLVCIGSIIYNFMGGFYFGRIAEYNTILGEKLEIEVKDFDPRLALDGGVDGLDFYREIGKKATEYLNDSGKIYLEIGIDQSKAVVECLQENFVDIKVLKDYSGIDRFITAKKR